MIYAQIVSPGSKHKAFEKVIPNIYGRIRSKSKHWTRIRTNNTLERLNKEIKRRTKVVGTFPDGESALMLVCARLRHVASSDWGTKRYLNMNHLKDIIIAREMGEIAS